MWPIVETVNTASSQLFFVEGEQKYAANYCNFELDFIHQFALLSQKFSFNYCHLVVCESNKRKKKYWILIFYKVKFTAIQD